MPTPGKATALVPPECVSHGPMTSATAAGNLWQTPNAEEDINGSGREPLYTAEAHVTDGRAQGHGRTSDGMVEVDLHLPAELGGDGGGTNPEELFAVGFAACFESALGVVARRRNWRAATLRSIPR